MRPSTPAHRVARALAIALVATACAVLPVRAASNPISADTGRAVPCTPGADRACLPTPVECALGGYNGHWDGGAEGRFADCTGGAGHVVHYEGGYTGADQVHGICGGVIDDDQVSAGGWADPNLCPPASASRGYGTAGRALPRAVRSRGGVVASSSPVAARVGVGVLDRGGNAVDAAAATVLAYGVAVPNNCGIGGVGSMVYRGAKGRTAALDFIATAPNAVTRDYWQNRPPGGIDQDGTGHRLPGVPGVVAGLSKALKRYGTISLAQAIAPAQRLAAHGVPVSTELATAYGQLGTVPGTPLPGPRSQRLRMFPETSKTYLRQGTLAYPPDNRLSRSILVQPDLARSLALIAKHGADAFYEDRSYPEGPSIARQILAEMREAREHPMYSGDDPVEWTRKDLASYRALWRKPVRGTYRGYEILGSAGATHGGLFTVEMLNILSGFPLGRSIAHSSADYFHVLAEAQKLVWADMAAYVGDQRFVRVPRRALTSRRFAARRRALIDRLHAKDYPPGKIPGYRAARAAPPPGRDSGHHTTSIAVVDRRGNAVAVTCSLGDWFGSAVVARGTGFALNDALNTFTPPGTPNEPRGGKRAVWVLDPEIVARHGRAVLAAGGAGNVTIPPGVTAFISNVVDFRMGLARAVDVARGLESCLAECPVVETFGLAPGMALEDGRVRQRVIDRLAARGHSIVYSGEYGLGPIVEAVGTDRASGGHLGVSDPRDSPGTTPQR